MARIWGWVWNMKVRRRHTQNCFYFLVALQLIHDSAMHRPVVQAHSALQGHRPVAVQQPAACRTYPPRRVALRPLAASTLDKSATSTANGAASQGNGAHAAQVPSVPTSCVPEELQMPPGQESHIDRVGKNLPADTFRCFGCTLPACQVNSQLLRSHAHHPCIIQVQLHQGLGELNIEIAHAQQSAAGCASYQWRYQPDGYLRAILTARVYDVAVSTGLQRNPVSPVCMRHGWAQPGAGTVREP